MFIYYFEKLLGHSTDVDKQGLKKYLDYLHTE